MKDKDESESSAGSAAGPEARPLPVLVSRRALGVRGVLALEPCAIASDWFGAPAPATASFTLAVDPETLWFVARCRQRPDHDASLTRGTFAERLWERDVAELFVGAAGSPAYRELNVSPAGAWWSRRFADYRRPDPGDAGAPPGVEAFAHGDDASWSAGLAVPRAALADEIRFDEATRINVCLIVGGDDRRYLSWRRAAGPPDFHDRACFAPILPIAI